MTFLSNWQRKVMILFIGILLYQFVYLTNKVETKYIKGQWIYADENLISVVSFLLILTILWELIMNEATWIKRLLFLIPTFLFTFVATIQYEPEEEIDNKMVYYLDALQNFGDTTTYFSEPQRIWYGFALIVAAWLLVTFLTTKARILLTGLGLVLYYAWMDTLSRHELDTEAAMTLLSILILLVMQHYSELMEEQERIWTFLSKNPMRVIASIAVICGVIIGANKFVWDIKPILPDPITIWNKLVNPQAGEGGGLEAGPGSAGGSKPPEEVLNNYGFEAFKLGGGFNYDASEIMTVTTSYKQYLRGQTRSIYNGEAWESSEAEKSATLEPIKQNASFDVFAANFSWVDLSSKIEKANVIESKQEITMLQKLAFPIYWGAYPIKQVNDVFVGEEPRAPEDFMLWTQYNEEIRYNKAKNLGFPDAYTVTSNLQRIDEEKIKKVDTKFLDFTLDEYKKNRWLKPYMTLPENYSPKVKELALKVITGKNTMYEQVRAIEEYLKKTYTYKNHPDTSIVKSKDFVEGFLFELKEGYCDYYSTAFVVMTRSIGLPARWVQGYTPGVGANEQANQSQGGATTAAPQEGVEDTYTIRNFNSHSWGEVFFEGYGWIPFEPTTGFIMPQLIKGKQAVVQEVVVEKKVETKVEEAKSPVLDAILKVLGYGFLTIFVVGSVLFAWKRRMILFYIRVFFNKRKKLSPNQIVLFEFEKMLYYASLSGFFHASSETAREIIQEWIANRAYLKTDMDQLLPIIERASYGKADLSLVDVNFATETVDKYRKGI